MQDAFGEPQGTVSRIHTGQVTMTILTKLQNRKPVTEVLCRAKGKFPGHLKIHISKKRVFTKFKADEFENTVAEKRFIPDGYGAKYIPNCGPQNKWWPLCSWESWHCPLLMPTNKSYFPIKKKKITSRAFPRIDGHEFPNWIGQRAYKNVPWPKHNIMEFENTADKEKILQTSRKKTESRERTRTQNSTGCLRELS